jgi:hypothetical protein
MSYIGPFYNAMSDDENIYSIDNFLSPGELSLGTIPMDYILEEIICICTSPCPSGTLCKIVDQNNNVIVPAGRLIVDRAISSTAVVNKRITSQINMSVVFTGSVAIASCELVLIKKIWRIP